MKIVIQSTNMYTFNKNPKKTLRLVQKHSRLKRADSIGIQEGGRPLSKGLRRFARYRTMWKRSKSHHDRNNPILVNRLRRLIGKYWSETAPGTGASWAPSRNVMVVFYKKRGKKIAHINTHFHVVGEELLARQPVGEYNDAGYQYFEHVKEVKRLMRKYKRQGYIVFVTADGNTRPKRGHDDWKFSGYMFLEFGPFVVTRRGIDFIIHDNSLVERTGFESIDKSKLGGADHPTLKGEYRLRA